MMYVILTAVFTLLCGLAYRLRGGGFITFGGDTAPRAIWAVTFGLTYAALKLLHINLIVLAWLIPAMFAAIALIPHAYCQQMGRGQVPNANPMTKRWPTCWLPQPSAAEWQAWSLSQRTEYDYLQMSVVSFLRGLIVFGPLMFLSPMRAGLAIVAITALQPFGYLVGWFMPFSLPSLSKNSSEWCELFNGFAWAITIIVITI